MKSRIRLVLTMFIWSVSLTLMAQNANRTGIFLELGAGYSMGNTPLIDASVGDEIIHFNYTDGAGMFFNGGWRQAISAQSALEGKVQFQFNFKDAGPTTLVKIMPGYKFFFRNKGIRNIYLGANIGLALGSSVVTQKYSSVGATHDPDGRFDGLQPAKAFNPMRCGLAYSAEIGYTLARYAYIAVSWEGQYLKQSSPIGYSMRNWGLIGAKFGYKFNL